MKRQISLITIFLVLSSFFVVAFGDEGSIPEAEVQAKLSVLSDLCDSKEECMQYCSSHQEQCQERLRKMQLGRIPPAEMAEKVNALSMYCSSPEECIAYCQENKEQCKEALKVKGAVPPTSIYAPDPEAAQASEIVHLTLPLPQHSSAHQTAKSIAPVQSEGSTLR